MSLVPVPMFCERPRMGNYYYDDLDLYSPVNRMEREQRYMTAMRPVMRPRSVVRPSYHYNTDRTMDRFTDQTGDWELLPYTSPSHSTVSHRHSPSLWNEDMALANTGHSTVSHRHSPSVWNGDMALSNTMQGFDQRVTDMSSQLRRMFEHMNQLLPVPILPKHNWENLKLENPIVSDGSEKKMSVQFDVRNFKPEEIQVKCSENLVQVHAKHEEKEGERSLYREYMRSFTLPQGVRHEALKSKLSHEGVLTVEAPCVSNIPAITADRDIPVTFEHKMIK